MDLLSSGAVLADGGIETAVVYGTDYPLPALQTVGMLDDPAGRRVLADLWTGYLQVAARHRLPAVVGTPTWRGGPDRLRDAGRPAADVDRLNRAGVAFQRELVDRLALDVPVWVAGVLAPRGDGYDPAGAPTADHAAQADALADADLLFAVPLPAAEEAVGLCRAMAATGTPYVPSFLVDPAGRLPDGTPLSDVIVRIDADVDPAPLYFSISCVHPSVAVAAGRAAGGGWARVKELKANGSSTWCTTPRNSGPTPWWPPGTWAAAAPTPPTSTPWPACWLGSQTASLLAG
ncbi:MAG TPA: homocysteine S-methyltransferase family protein [Acidimicrobiales bacterium]|nr:homocysteine S-methyltransferase family protein [Acidimicrobiales bacterium]